MYSVYADNTLLYNSSTPLSKFEVVSPRLILADNQAGSLSLTLTPNNICYSSIKRLTTDISVYSDDDEIWSGRVLTEKTDFYKNRILYCEGALAFFNDSIQPQAEYHNMSVRGFLETLVTIHNNKVGENRRFTVGTVTVTDPNDSLYRYTNYETTLDCINDKLINRLGGHIRVRYEDGERYLDYLADYPNTNSQVIRFGKNLMDFTKNWDMSDFATVLLPLGCREEESDIDALDSYLTVESVNGGSKYVISASAVASYGRIEKVVKWDDVTEPSNLLSKANQYLSEIQFDNVVLEVSALDMHYMDVNVQGIKHLDKIRIESPPHGLNRLFPVSKLDTPLDSPDDTIFTLGDNVRMSLSTSSKKANSDLLRTIDEIPKKHTILQEAKENATAIMKLSTEGYITITHDQYGSDNFYIANSRNLEDATKFWLWNMNGLAYSNDGGETFGLAITMDGAIVADYITAGTLNGDLLRAGSVSTNAISQAFKTSISNDIDGAKTLLRQEFTAADGTLASNISQTYATKSEVSTSISQTATSITTEVNKKVNATDFGTYMEQNYNSFILGFNNNSRTVQISTSGISIYDGTISSSNRLITFNENGMILYDSGTMLGHIGTNHLVSDTSYKGIVFDLDYAGKYMAWARKETSSSSTYTIAMIYARVGGSYTNEGFHFGCNMYLHGKDIDTPNLVNARSDGYSTYTGTRRFITDVQIDGQGNLVPTYVDYDIKNGMFIN